MPALHLALAIIAIVLTVLELVESRATSKLAWAVLILIALLAGWV